MCPMGSTAVAPRILDHALCLMSCAPGRWRWRCRRQSGRWTAAFVASSDYAGSSGEHPTLAAAIVDLLRTLQRRRLDAGEALS
jgi:hypothetical protein